MGLSEDTALVSGLAQVEPVWGLSGVIPALYLDFLADIPLDPRITFSRDGTPTSYHPGTRVNSAGLIETVPVNLVPMSNTFTDAGWAKLGTGTPAIVVAAASVPDPFGGANAWEVDLSGAADDRIAYTGAALTAVNNAGMTISFWAKAKTSDGTICAAIRRPDGAIDVSPPQAIVTSAWTWISYFFAGMAGVSSALPYVGYRAGGGTCQNYYIFGCQLQSGSTATTYIPTTTTPCAAPRFDYNPVTLAPRGLLIEEGRTNLLTYSNDFRNTAEAGAARPRAHTRSSVTRGGDTAPDGSTNACRLIDDATAANTHYTNYNGSISITAGATYTYSVMLKAGSRTFAAIELTDSTAASGARVGVNLITGAVGTPFAVGTGSSIAADSINMGNGWWRVRLTCIVDVASVLAATRVYGADSLLAAGFPSYNGDGGSYFLAFGEQLEAGANPTSYIPTTTAAVTRAADVASMTGTNFSSWFNPVEGTFVAAGDTAARIAGQAPVVWAANGGSLANVIWEYYNGAANQSLQAVSGGVSQGNVNIANATTILKSASAYMAAGYNHAANGTLGTPTGAVTLPTVDRLQLGGAPSSTYLNGHLQRITYFNKRLPDATLKGLSA